MQVKPRVVEYYRTTTGKEPAKEWLNTLKDKVTQAIIYKRIRQAGLGYFGKTRGVGDGVLELKIDFGPGYRVYFGIRKDELILILVGGSKRTQPQDIQKARSFWLQWRKENGEKE